MQKCAYLRIWNAVVKLGPFTALERHSPSFVLSIQQIPTYFVN